MNYSDICINNKEKRALRSVKFHPIYFGYVGYSPCVRLPEKGLFTLDAIAVEESDSFDTFFVRGELEVIHVKGDSKLVSISGYAEGFVQLASPIEISKHPKLSELIVAITITPWAYETIMPRERTEFGSLFGDEEEICCPSESDDSSETVGLSNPVTE